MNQNCPKFPTFSKILKVSKLSRKCQDFKKKYKNKTYLKTFSKVDPRPPYIRSKLSINVKIVLKTFNCKKKVKIPELSKM